MGHDRIRSKAGLALVARVRGLCGNHPGVTEEIDKFGHTSFRVGKKPFVMLGESEDAVHMSIKADLRTQAALIKQGGYERTPYIGQHGWVSVENTKKLNWPEIEELITDGYRATAPAKVRAQFEEQTGQGVKGSGGQGVRGSGG